MRILCSLIFVSCLAFQSLSAQEYESAVRLTRQLRREIDLKFNQYDLQTQTLILAQLNKAFTLVSTGQLPTSVGNVTYDSCRFIPYRMITGHGEFEVNGRIVGDKKMYNLSEFIRLLNQYNCGDRSFSLQLRSFSHTSLPHAIFVGDFVIFKGTETDQVLAALKTLSARREVDFSALAVTVERERTLD